MKKENCYLKKLDLVWDEKENEYILSQKRTCYNGIYPFKIFPNIFADKEFRCVEFEPITIFYGGNGSGKTTLLNIIAEGTGVNRHSAFNGSAFFADYVRMCKFQVSEIPRTSHILTSDDVSDYILNIRCINDGIETRKSELLEEYLDRKYSKNTIRSLSQYDDWKNSYDAKSKSQSAFVRERLMRNVDMFSNGETAIKYYVERINENSLYLIDEPENSLSPKLQLELMKYIYASYRYYNCQFVISTHSPFLLSLQDAKIIDLDAFPAATRKWTELENVQMYYKFFKEHETELTASQLTTKQKTTRIYCKGESDE